MNTLIPAERIERRILILRGHKVMLDADLAELYGVPTKALNQAVRRNRGRFPADFAFRLTAAEKAGVVTSCDHLHRLKFSPVMPHAFTEHGALALSFVAAIFEALRKLTEPKERLSKRPIGFQA